MIVTLLTDFGTADSFVAAMKGVILSRDPRIAIVDITHEVPPQDAETAGFVLSTVYRDFPPGTVHLAVVDPGVGSARPAIAASAGGWYFVGPDNGLLDWSLRREHSPSVRAISAPPAHREAGSQTFHGRDLFAPVAAALAGGDSFDATGPSVADWVRAPAVEPRPLEGGGVVGVILHIDRFGNGITSFTRGDLPPAADAFTFRIGSGRVTEARDYFSAGDGVHPFVYWGSAGYLEIAVNGGSAQDLLGFERGSPVEADPR